tara:strand:- start:4940 stop:5617 length:678 start_codon:yes stop_codon:yes gene_type:complete
VLNIDWSVSLIIKKNFFLRILLSKLLSKERQNNLKKLSQNIIVHDLRNGIPYANNSIDAVYHSHLLEHIDRTEVKDFLMEIFRVLKPNGVQRIVVPDLYFLCKSYVENYEKCINQNKLIKKHDDYVAAILEQAVRKEASGSSKQNKILRKIENLILGDARKRGETHQWMYDSVNLKSVLNEVGFKNIKVQTFKTSYIFNWNKYGLDLDKENKEYKKGSLYIEARK